MREGDVFRPRERRQISIIVLLDGQRIRSLTFVVDREEKDIVGIV